MTTTNTETTTGTPASTGQLALSAVVAAFHAQRETALAQISLFINNPAGVADHNNFVEEIQQCVTQLTEANAALATTGFCVSMEIAAPVWLASFSITGITRFNSSS